jgi:hypothetical protein
VSSALRVVSAGFDRRSVVTHVVKKQHRPAVVERVVETPNLWKSTDGGVTFSALETLARNVTKAFNYAEPVLIEGSNYSGVWMECGPLEGLARTRMR